MEKIFAEIDNPTAENFGLRVEVLSDYLSLLWILNGTAENLQQSPASSYKGRKEMISC